MFLSYLFIPVTPEKVMEFKKIYIPVRIIYYLMILAGMASFYTPAAHFSANVFLI